MRRNCSRSVSEGPTDSGFNHSTRPAAIPHPLAASLARAIAGARHWLLAAQQPDGHWVGELEGDTILESEYILLLAYLGRHQTTTARKAARYILQQQLPGGGWAMYPGGPVDISAQRQGLLRLEAHRPRSRPPSPCSAPGPPSWPMAGPTRSTASRASTWRLLGQISYDQCPAVPPEMVLLPSWFPINLYVGQRLEPDDHRAAGHHVGLPAGDASSIRDWAFANCSSGRPNSGRRCVVRAWPAAPGLLSWDRFFRTAGSRR